MKADDMQFVAEKARALADKLAPQGASETTLAICALVVMLDGIEDKLQAIWNAMPE